MKENEVIDLMIYPVTVDRRAGGVLTVWTDPMASEETWNEFSDTLKRIREEALTKKCPEFTSPNMIVCLKVYRKCSLEKKYNEDDQNIFAISKAFEKLCEDIGSANKLRDPDNDYYGFPERG